FEALASEQVVELLWRTWAEDDGGDGWVHERERERQSRQRGAQVTGEDEQVLDGVELPLVFGQVGVEAGGVMAGGGGGPARLGGPSGPGGRGGPPAARPR